MYTVLLALLPLIAAGPFRRWPTSTLEGATEQKGRYFGTAFAPNNNADRRYSAILDSQFGQYTPENEMKWEVVEPQRGVFNWTGGDLVVAEAKKTGAIVRGHNFVWHQQTPTYVTNITDKTELTQVLTDHVNAVMNRWGRDFYAFDVINEPLYDNGTLRDSVWYNVLGPNYMADALRIAHAAAPNVKLYINDYNIEGVNNKSMALHAIAQDLLNQGAPLHGIGFESHFIGGQVPTTLAQSMKMFTDLGLDVAITELDVRVPVNNSGIANSTWLDIEAKDQAHVVQTCLENARCPGVTVWEFSDAVSWIPGVFAGFGSACLWGLEYEQKPAYYSVLNTVQAENGAVQFQPK